MILQFVSYIYVCIYIYYKYDTVWFKEASNHLVPSIIQEFDDILHQLTLQIMEMYWTRQVILRRVCFFLTQGWGVLWHVAIHSKSLKSPPWSGQQKTADFSPTPAAAPENSESPHNLPTNLQTKARCQHASPQLHQQKNNGVKGGIHVLPGKTIYLLQEFTHDSGGFNMKHPCVERLPGVAKLCETQSMENWCSDVGGLPGLPLLKINRKGSKYMYSLGN